MFFEERCLYRMNFHYENSSSRRGEERKVSNVRASYQTTRDYLLSRKRGKSRVSGKEKSGWARSTSRRTQQVRGDEAGESNRMDLFKKKERLRLKIAKRKED